jgi:hypothetical protein
MEEAGDATGEDTGGFPADEPAAEPVFPDAPALDAPIPEVAAMEIPEENKLTEWLANWKIELEAKNGEHDNATALVKSKVRTVLRIFG